MAVHALMVLAAFTLAAIVTYAVVLAVLTAASSASEEPWLDAHADADDDDPEVGSERRTTPVSC
ncbi:hypothetical protein ASC64_02315 [Nocardioides sp. Root122]|uniref:hypothetical protein n=1 Tax=Nocardioides TaxID=1839 RepID=UPI000703151A|nr:MULTISPECIES: hypothetical protein [Nocardioides]KQV77684.1 hypothetical protein ASC64_02315 [Nocardioides sp. Root122]MCK9822142.1 hypothetical protein [Nocardioides cavernae]